MQNEWILYVVTAVSLLIALFLFWQWQRQQAQLSEIGSKQEQLKQEKNTLEQWVVQYQTQLENAKHNLAERAAQSARLQQELNDAAQKEDQLEQVINQLNEKIGAAQATAQGLNEQLAFGQQLLGEKAQENRELSQQLQFTRQELAELRTTLQEKQANFAEQQQQFQQMRGQMSSEFQLLAQQIFEEKSKSFAQTNQSSLDLLLAPFKAQIEAFQKRVNEVHSESVQGAANLNAELKRVLDIGLSMSQEAQNLTTALKGNNKIAGNWGEVQLESALQYAGLLAGEHYETQAHYRDQSGQRFLPDFVLRLPDNKHLILDSKVSLIAYEQAILAENDAQQQQALKAHCDSLRTHIDGLSKKNYANLIGIKSPDFVLMFVPIEPAYIEAMKFDSQLFNYGYERNVILVSYTTLMPILRTVANLWRIERGNSEAREIAEKAGDIYNQICVIAERMAKVGDALNNVNKHYNHTVTALVGKQGLVGKVEKFQKLSGKASQLTPQIELLDNEAETLKLEMLVEKDAPELAE